MRGLTCLDLIAEWRGLRDLQPLIQIKEAAPRRAHTQPKAEEARMIQHLERLIHPVQRAARALVPVVPVALLAACAPEPVPSPGAAAYQDYCAICHGPRAKGDGELAQRLAVPPPDLTTIAAANGGVFPLRAVADSVYGYSGKHEADLMPEFSPLLDGPEVSVTSAEGTIERMPQRLAEMVLYIQSLQRP